MFGRKNILEALLASRREIPRQNIIIVRIVTTIEVSESESHTKLTSLYGSERSLINKAYLAVLVRLYIVFAKTTIVYAVRYIIPFRTADCFCIMDSAEPSIPVCFAQLEQDLFAALETDATNQIENEAKLRAVSQRVSYEEFKY